MKYPRVAYSADFKQACSAVKEGKAGYCILPIYEKGSYRIPSISTQLFAFDLKIVSVTPVFGMTGDADVTYGLVSSGFSVPKITEGDDRYFEILIPAGGERLLELFVAAEELEIEVYGVNSQIYEGEDGKVRFYSVTFRKSEGNFSDFIAYLILFMPDFVPTGLYLNLE
jgi:hypothetical protein